VGERHEKLVEDVRAHEPLGVAPAVDQRHLRNGGLDPLVEGRQV
jgi:hypothetical protein